ncbi:MAG: acetate--CoA ligase family protein [Desulfitobacteriaceae bacterium]
MTKTTGLEAFLQPKRVAVIGASSQEDKLGFTLAKNVLEYGYTGELYLINPKGGRVFDRPILLSILETGNVDLALISVPAVAVPSVVEECGKAGVKAAVILSSGFAETGETGRRLQAEVMARAERNGLRLIGPNCMGIFNLNADFNGTYFWALPRMRGHISFISQSGAMGGLFFQKMKERHAGIAKFISVGNMADLTHGELVAYLADDPETHVIGLFVEGIPEGRVFQQQLARASQVKPVVILKVGRTAAGKRAALSHTGSLAGEGAVLQAAMAEIGVHWANTSEEFFDMLTALGENASYPLRRDGLGIITISGGPAVLASDLAEEQGLAVPSLAAQTIAGMRSHLIDFAAYHNPVDMTPQTAPENYPAIVSALAADPAVGGLLAINVGLNKEEFARALVGVRENSGQPVLSYTVDTPEIDQILKESHIPMFPTLEGALRGFRALMAERERLMLWDKVLKTPPTQPSSPAGQYGSLWEQIKGKPQINEFDTKRILQAWGIPVVRENLVSDWPSLRNAAEKIGFPLALKVCRDEIIHKSEQGGVNLNLRDEAALHKAWLHLAERFPEGPFLVQEMVRSDLELILGGRRDPVFGPVVMVGLGGTAVEVFKDISLGLAPLTTHQAREMVRGLKSAVFLKGFRGRAPLPEEGVVNILVQLGELLSKHPELTEVDLNPLLLNPQGIWVADASMVIAV